MKKYFYFFLLFLIGVYFEGCQENQKYQTDNIEKIHIRVNEIEDSVKFSEVFDNITYIPIATSDSILIGGITDFVVSNNRFFILDRKKTHSIFVVDETGKHITQINKQGPGPNEYIDPIGITIDKDKKNILVLCNKSRRILSYNFNGDFIESQKIRCASFAIGKTKSDNIVHYLEFLADDEYYQKSSYPNLIILDKKNKLIDRKCFFNGNINSQIPWVTKKRFSTPYPDTASINPDHTNIIYYISSNKITPRFYIDYQNYNINKDYEELAMVSRPPSSDYLEKLSMKYGITMNFQESQNFIYLLSILKGEFFHSVFSKKTGKIHSFKILKGMPSDFKRIYMVDNVFYSIVEPSYIKKYAEISNNPKLQKIAQNIHDLDNPIIIKATLKDF